MTGDLPGGLWERGERRRRFALRPVTGQLELAIAEAVETAPSFPAAVTGTLALAVEHVGGLPAAPVRMAALCVADRQYLLARLLVHLQLGRRWHQASCAACGTTFDFHLDIADLPAREAPPGYPFATVRLGGARLRFRLPNGADQEAIAALDDDRAASWALARRCWMAPPAAGRRWQRVVALGEAGLERIEGALEAVTPAMPAAVAAPCPQCQRSNEVGLDLTAALDGGAEGLLREVAQLAGHYHWGEAEILGMPRQRRQRYLRLVDEARGLAN